MDAMLANGYKHAMNYELQRLFSYSKFDLSFDTSSLHLARAGFYLNNDDEIKCYFCSLTVNVWKASYDPLTLHTAMSKNNCPHANGELTENVPVCGQELINTHQVTMENRGKSVDGLTASLSENAASNNYGESKTEDSIDIGEPGLIKNLPESTEMKASTPKEKSKRTGENATAKTDIPNSNEENSPNASEEPTSSNSTDYNPATFKQALGVMASQLYGTIENLSVLMNGLTAQIKQPQFPGCSDISVRRQTLQQWPEKQEMNLEEMAASGLFYMTSRGNIMCFYCGGGLKDWDPKDDPWEEHARWFPWCSFLKEKKGDEYIQHVQEVYTERKAGPDTSPASDSSITSPSDSSTPSPQDSIVPTNGEKRDELSSLSSEGQDVLKDKYSGSRCQERLTAEKDSFDDEDNEEDEDDDDDDEDDDDGRPEVHIRPRLILNLRFKTRR